MTITLSDAALVRFDGDRLWVESEDGSELFSQRLNLWAFRDPARRREAARRRIAEILTPEIAEGLCGAERDEDGIRSLAVEEVPA